MEVWHDISSYEVTSVWNCFKGMIRSFNMIYLNQSCITFISFDLYFCKLVKSLLNNEFNDKVTFRKNFNFFWKMLNKVRGYDAFTFPLSILCFLKKFAIHAFKMSELKNGTSVSEKFVGFRDYVHRHNYEPFQPFFF